MRAMRDTYAILALRRKRAYLAGEIAQAERQLADKYSALKNLDSTIQLFAPTTNPELIPAIRPTRHGLFFRHGEQMRLCRDALREADGPMSARQVAEYAMRAKGLPTDNAPILASIAVHVRVALGLLEARGLVVKIISSPDAWWVLAGEGS
jgi:hypothetical protein